MTLQWILVYRQPARTRVVRNFAIGGTSRPERRGVGVGGGYILGLSHKLPVKVTIENKLRSFQIKLLHNINSTNQCLWIEDEDKNFLSARHVRHVTYILKLQIIAELRARSAPAEHHG